MTVRELVILPTMATSASPPTLRLCSTRALSEYADYDVDTDLDIIRGMLYEEEKSNPRASYTIASYFGKGFISEYERDSFKSYAEYAGSGKRRKGESHSRNGSLLFRAGANCDAQENGEVSDFSDVRFFGDLSPVFYSRREREFDAYKSDFFLQNIAKESIIKGNNVAEHLKKVAPSMVNSTAARITRMIGFLIAANSTTASMQSHSNRIPS